MPNRSNFIRMLPGLLLASAWSLPAGAQESYPSKPIRLIIPYGPGGSLDPIGRILGDEVGRKLGQPVVVENIAGANGMLGVQRLLQSPPDGHTLLVGITSNIVLGPLVTPAIKFTSADLEALNYVGNSGLVIIAGPSFKAKSLAELLDMARSKPGSITYGVPGIGSMFHLAMESLLATAGVKMTMVPYKGAGPASIDVMGGQVDIAVVGLPAMLPLIAENKLKALAVLSKARDIGNPDIPAAAETKGLEGVDYTVWTGLFAPKGLSAAVRSKIHGAVASTLEMPSVVTQYSKIGVAVAKRQSPEEFGAFVGRESRKLKEEIQRTNLKTE